MNTDRKWYLVEGYGGRVLVCAHDAPERENQWIAVLRSKDFERFGLPEDFDLNAVDLDGMDPESWTWSVWNCYFDGLDEDYEYNFYDTFEEALDSLTSEEEGANVLQVI